MAKKKYNTTSRREKENSNFKKLERFLEKRKNDNTKPDSSESKRDSK